MLKKCLICGVIALSMLTGCGKEEMGSVTSVETTVDEKTENGKSVSEIVNDSIYSCINGSEQISGIVNWNVVNEDEISIRVELKEENSLSDEEKELVENTIKDGLKDVNKTVTITFEKAE